MANNSNDIWRKISIVFTIVVTLTGVSIVYGQLAHQVKTTVVDVQRNTTKIELVSEKLTGIQIQIAQVLEGIKYLKEKL